MSLRRASPDDVRAHLTAGGLACFPTETLWALSCDARNTGAIDRLRAAKRRPPSVPLAVGFPSWDAARSAVEATPLADALAARFLPGPLSIVVRRANPALAAVAPHHDTLSVRVPDHPVALALLDRPLVMTSANSHGEPDPVTLDELHAALADVDENVLVAGDGPVAGTGSTVVDATGDRPRVLREGVIPIHEVEAAWL